MDLFEVLWGGFIYGTSEKFFIFFTPAFGAYGEQTNKLHPGGNPATRGARAIGTHRVRAIGIWTPPAAKSRLQLL